MKRFLVTLAALSVAAGLAACGRTEKVAAAAAPPADDMSKMDMPAGAKMAKGTGVVKAADPKAGTLTLDHGRSPRPTGQP